MYCSEAAKFNNVQALQSPRIYILGKSFIIDYEDVFTWKDKELVILAWQRL